MAFYGRVIEDKKLRRKLETLPSKIQRRALGKGLKAAGIMVRDEIKPNVPIEEGDLYRSIAYKMKIVPKQSKGYVVIGSKFSKPTNLLALIEYGWTTTAGRVIPGKYILTSAFARVRKRAEKAIINAIQEYLRRL